MSRTRIVEKRISPSFQNGWMTVVASTLLSLGAASAADLEVEVRGVRMKGGEVHAALFDRAEDFVVDLQVRVMFSSSGEIQAGIFASEDDLPRPPVGLLSVSPGARTLRFTFADLAPGDYAVGIYQDRNNNGRLDTTVVGVPVEPWGLSNNARPTDRDPTWEEAKFSLPETGVRIVIDLR